METYSVYVHVFPNGKRYFEITCQEDINRRFQNGYGYRGQKLLYNAIKKYGWNNIEHKVLHSGISKEEACSLEIKYIHDYGTTSRENGYNISRGGESNGKPSAETRAKISKMFSGSNHPMYGKHISQEHKDKISAALKGRPLKEETKIKISKARKGKPGRVWTEESRKKVSKSLKGRKLSEKQKLALREKNNSYLGKAANARKVICIDTGEIFNSLVEAGKSVNSSKNSIWRVCVGERKTLRKKRFAYLDEYVKED